MGPEQKKGGRVLANGNACHTGYLEGLSLCFRVPFRCHFESIILGNTLLRVDGRLG